MVVLHDINFWRVEFNNDGSYPDIINSVQSFDMRRGSQYKPDYCDVIIATPITDTAGNTYVWGTDIDYSTEFYFFINFWTIGYYPRADYTHDYGYFRGRVTSAERTGNIIKFRMMQDTYFGSRGKFSENYSSTTQAAIIADIFTDAGIANYTALMHDENITGVSFSNANIITAVQHVLEICDPTYWYQNYLNLGTFSTSHGNYSTPAQMNVYIYNYSAGPALTFSDAMLTLPHWGDKTARIINDVVVKYAGGYVTASNTSSIETYGKRSVTLNRMEWTNSTDAQCVANSIVAVFKDPKDSATVELDLRYLTEYVIPGLAITLTDPVAGKTKQVPIKEVIIHYPSNTMTAYCDELIFNTSDYIATMENRVTMLETNQPDQELNTDNSPSFAAVTTTGDVSVGDELRITTDSGGYIKARDQLKFRDIDSASEAQYIDLISGTHYIAGTTEHNDAYLVMTRAADNVSWTAGLLFYPYSTISSSNPVFRISQTNKTTNDHDLHFQHYDGSTYTTLLELTADKTLDIGSSILLRQGTSQVLGSSRMIYAKDYPFKITASANYHNTHDAEDSYTWLSAYAKQKTITLDNGLGPGTYRVYFEIKGAAAPSVVYGKVYKDGIAIGTQRTVTGTTYGAFTEDFSGPLEPGTTIELWCYQNGGDASGGYDRNFRIGYDLNTDPTMPSANS